MNENEMNGMEGMEEDVIVFEDEDGQEYEFSVVDYFFYNGEEYALLTENGTEGTEQKGTCRNAQRIPLTKNHNGQSKEACTGNTVHKVPL